MICILLGFRFSQSFMTVQPFLGNPWGKNCQNFQRDNHQILTIDSVSITVSDDIYNILPQGMNNGVTQFVWRENGKSHVYFEALRPNFMQGNLNFVKLNNLFWAAINKNICMK